MSKIKHNIKQLELSERLKSLPLFVGEIVQQAIDMLSVNRVWLFGSQIRRDANEKSDFDLAFELLNQKHANWSKFCSHVQENTRTLKHIDLVLFNTASSAIQKRICDEGVVIYDKESKE